MDFVLGPFSFSSNFECGNLAKVLPIHLPGSAGASSSHKVSKTPSHIRGNDTNQVDYEFNLWTKPDCGGTEFENNNRTWFCFCIKGGTAGEKAQLSVMNLNKQSKLYSQGMQPVVKCVGECVQSHYNWERIKEKCSYRSEDNSTVITWIHTVPPENKTTYYAFTYPYTYTELQSFLSILDQRFMTNSSSLYYCRELVTTSLDGSRVDLVTITSHLGKLEEREDRLDDLFPEWSFPRPHRFEGKKVVLVSARVHPGETPSSFVLNGFLNFIISSDSRAKKLRDIFIFKIIPMLNPDGVIRGHYRSDQRGINLNRVYNNPSAKFHPTIYAAKKLILYYHKMSRETALNVCDDGITSNVKDNLEIPSPEKSTPSLLDEDTCHSFSDAVINKSKTTSTISSSANKPHSVLDADEPSVSGWDCSSNMSADSLCRAGAIQNTWEEIQEESNKLYSSGETGVTSMFGSMSPLQDFKILSKDTFKLPSKSGDILNIENLRTNLSNQSDYILNREEPHIDLGIGHSSSPKSSAYLFHTDKRSESSSLQIPSGVVPALDNFVTLHSPTFLSSSVLSNSKSDLFMYIDLHGHASKRGIFMYGNWFENPVLMVENMLYPRLLAANCTNFDFGACNFSERNMYHRDRRDGMSKEGSGRVSVMRATGLIRSYTLECNYNTGRHFSPYPPQGSQGRPLYSVPPKYTPAIFEDCGYKLGISLHDLIESSDSSKSPSATSIDINALRTELYNALSNAGVSPRTSNISSCSVSGLTPSPKLGSLKTNKDLKSSSEERTEKTPTCKAKKSLLSKVNSPVGTTFSQKIGNIYTYTGNRRPSLSSAVDTENQEPISPRARSTKPKTSKNKKDTSVIDPTSVKAKKLRYKSSKKLTSQTLLYKEIGEASHFSSEEKLNSPKHNLTSSICIPSDISFKVSTSEKSESKLMKKIEKGRKPRTKTLKFGSKKFKNLPSSESSSASFKADQFSKIPLNESDDNLGGALPIDSCCVSPQNPLSPRSPLASVFEAQTSQPTQASNLNLKQKSTSYVSSSKSTFHSCAKRQPKAIKSIPSSSDRYSAGVPPATGQRLKLFPKKLKKKPTIVGEVASAKILSKPTTSQSSLPWVIRKPLKIGGEIESPSSVNPRVVKKRKKSPRKSL